MKTNNKKIWNQFFVRVGSCERDPVIAAKLKMPLSLFIQFFFVRVGSSERDPALSSPWGLKEALRFRPRGSSDRRNAANDKQTFAFHNS